MKKRFIKLFAVGLSIAVLGGLMTSCGVFFDEENNFVGLNNVIEFIYGE